MKSRAAAMRARWADPAWRDRTMAAMSERAKGKRYGTQARGQRLGDKLGLKVYLDEDDFSALRAAAIQLDMSVSEIARTYIAWGIENDGGET